jgi:hypothetical protein
VLAISYTALNELLGQSEATLQALHHAADVHESENVSHRAIES